MFIRKIQDLMGGVKAQDIKNIKDDSNFDDSYDGEKWRGFVIATVTLDGMTS